MGQMFPPMNKAIGIAVIAFGILAIYIYWQNSDSTPEFLKTLGKPKDK